MLSRFDDKAIDNRKIEEAADLLDGIADGGKPGRRFGYTRAYGAWSWSVTYANAHLTDGLLTRRAIEKYRIGKAECDALVAVGSWDVAPGGAYQIHDFLDWNPSAAQVKAKQSKDRDRKRKAAGYDEDSTRRSTRKDDGVALDSSASCADAGAPAGLGRAGTGEEEPTRSEGLGEPERGPAVGRPAGLMRPAPRNAVFAGKFVVPDFLHDEFERLSGKTYDELMAWYRRLDADWRDRPIGEGDLKFLRARFGEWIGATPKADGPPIDARDVFKRARRVTADANLDVLLS